VCITRVENWDKNQSISWVGDRSVVLRSLELVNGQGGSARHETWNVS